MFLFLTLNERGNHGFSEILKIGKQRNLPSSSIVKNGGGGALSYQEILSPIDPMVGKFFRINR